VGRRFKERFPFEIRRQRRRGRAFAALGTALATGSGEDMKRIRVKKPKLRGADPGPEVLSLDPRDPDVRRAVALARAAGSKDVAST